MRISDWSSDVCSSDLLAQAVGLGDPVQLAQGQLQPGAQRVAFSRGGKAGFHAVEQRQQVGKQALVGEAARALELAGHALALVVQVGTLAQRIAAQLLQFRPQRLQLGDQRVVVVSHRSEEHTSELQSLMRISYAVFCLTTNKQQQQLKQLTQ